MSFSVAGIGSFFVDGAYSNHFVGATYRLIVVGATYRRCRTSVLFCANPRALDGE